MFTGIVRERARVASFQEGRLVVESATPAGIGDSVALNGVCLTVVEADGGRLAFDVVEETLRRAKPFGDEVNVEPALRAGEPMGGHIVQGHVDGVGRVRSYDDLLWIDPPAELLRYCVEKGSIAVDGVALTIAALDERGFGIAIVPYTRAATTLGSLTAGDPVNLEVDVLAKHLERLIESRGLR